MGSANELCTGQRTLEFSGGGGEIYKLWEQQVSERADMYIYIYVCVCVCVCDS
jgi:hypothetical protein